MRVFLIFICIYFFLYYRGPCVRKLFTGLIMYYPLKTKNIVLYCIVLYCIVLYCIVLYCIVLYCIVLYCIVFVLYCIVLYCIVLYCIVLKGHVLHRARALLKVAGLLTRLKRTSD